MKWLLLPLSLCGSILLSGCGGSSSGSPTPASPSLRYDPTVAHVPSCAHPTRAIPLPKGFPTRFPFPRGTVLTKSGPLPLRVKGVGIDGFVPSAGFKQTVTFFPREVRHAGFKVLDYQADAPNDSEGTYRGYGRVGAWRLHRIPGCPGAMVFGASSEPPSRAVKP